MNVGKRSAITVPLTVRVLITAAAAGVLTLTVYAMTYGGMAPNHGKPVMMLAVLAIPLMVGAKATWSVQASLAFAFFVYFLVVFAWLLIGVESDDRRWRGARLKRSGSM